MDSPAAMERHVPEALQAPLRAFMFETESWLRPRAVAAALGYTQAPPDAGLANGPGWRRLTAQVAPPGRLDVDLVCADLRGRLALLSRTDWLRLGLCVCVLPSCGQIQRSMDGHFRRVVRQLLDEEAMAGLDRMEALPAERPVDLSSPGAWRAPEALAAAGLRAAMTQACRWTDPVRRRVELHFEPDELAGPPAVGGLDMRWMEIACKALWPDHPWLWS